MNDTLSLDTLEVAQKALQEDYDKASQAMYAAKGKHAKKKDALVTFNNKYGRVIALMQEA